MASQAEPATYSYSWLFSAPGESAVCHCRYQNNTAYMISFVIFDYKPHLARQTAVWLKGLVSRPRSYWKNAHRLNKSNHLEKYWPSVCAERKKLYKHPFLKNERKKCYIVDSYKKNNFHIEGTLKRAYYFDFPRKLFIIFSTAEITKVSMKCITSNRFSYNRILNVYLTTCNVWNVSTSINI